MKTWIVHTPSGSHEVLAAKVSIQGGALMMMDGEAVKKIFAQGAWMFVEPKERPHATE